MRITIDTDDCNAPERVMSTFHEAEAAVAYMRHRMQFDPGACCILTREAAADFLGEHYEEIDDLPYQLMREIHPHDNSCEEEQEGVLCFTNVQYGDIDTIHDSVPCGAEIREFVRSYECWQLWMR